MQTSRTVIPLVVLCCCAFVRGSTVASEVAPANPRFFEGYWPARWVTAPEGDLHAYGVYHFRRTFDLAESPARFVIHVSADNRYQLFVNARRVCCGPSRGTLDHWRFETVDVAPYLQKGRNVIAAVVWNFGEASALAQVSNMTAFLVQGDTPTEEIVNTGRDWKVIQNRAYAPIPSRELLNTFVGVGPGDRVDAAAYAWGWQQVDYNDGTWKRVRLLGHGVAATGFGETYGQKHPQERWNLTPREIPPMEEQVLRIPRLARTEGGDVDGSFLKGDRPVTLPAHQRIKLLLDQTYLTSAYPELVVSGGRGSTLEFTYAEALVDSRGEKGNRNDIENRHIIGFKDVFLPNGQRQIHFRPLEFRTYRYVQLDIQTAEEPLILEDLFGTTSAYPFVERATFQSEDASLAAIWNVGWRTLRLCANETYYDNPYYERLQYAGDTRIEALVSLTVSGDDRLMRNAIRLFDDSRQPDGLTQSRSPSSLPQIMPTWSLFWIAMIHDHFMHVDDCAFARSFLLGIRGVLDWYERHLDDTGMLGPMGWWNFVDWAYRDGVPPGGRRGHSAILSLQFAYHLGLAAELTDALGSPGDAAHYRQVSASVKKAVYDRCWDAERGLLADSPQERQFSQHTNVFAVLVDMFPPEQATQVMQKVLEDSTLTQATYYFKFYLIRALKKAHMGDRVFDVLKPWKDMLALGLTTFAETPEPTRADCQGWGSIPNYELLATVCGIEPAAPGFKRVRIAPNLGPLRWIKGRVPHPCGMITVAFERTAGGGLVGEIVLPEGLSGQLSWKRREVSLTDRTNKIELK